MKTIQLVFGAHCHQPEGGLAPVFESHYQRVYKPFLSVLNGYPEFPAVLYYGGPLLEWMEEAHPEFLMLLEEMVRRKQVELLSGGFYEPILAMIPTSDKLGQMEKMTTYLRARFGTRPRGCWLPHQVWEPSLVLALRNSGMDFTFLDDRFFRIAGLDGDRIHYPCLTEDQGKTVVVFPIGHELQEAALRQPPKQLLAPLRELADESGRRVAVLLLEAESLGREEVRRRLFDQRGLARLLEAVWENREWLQPLTPRRYLRQHLPQGRVYFPCLSSQEVASQCLNAGQKRRILSPRPGEPAVETALLAGGFFRRCLTRYPEIDLLYSRMIYTHLLVNQVRGDKYKKNAARTELWKGQSGTLYWNAPAGGVHTNHLRKAAYRAFLEAEEIARISEMFIPSIISLDFDMDGENEFLYQGESINAYVHKRGGVLFELDFLPIHWNYLDTMARWPEPYHERPQDGCDRYWRKAFLDHFFPPKTSLQRFERMEYEEAGDFIDRPFEMVHLDREKPELLLRRAGTVLAGGQAYPLLLEKRFLFRKSELELQLRLSAPPGRTLSLWYASEINLAMASQETVRLYGIHGQSRRALAGERAESAALDGLEARDLQNGALMELAASQPFDLWTLPIETVPPCRPGLPPAAREEAGQRVYQSTCLVPGWKIRLGGEPWSTTLMLSLKKEEA